MSSRRVQKVAEAIREVVSMAILTELKDPRVEHVTVTYVEVSPDLRQAKVHVSIMGNEVKQQLSLRGLESAAGFLQSKVAARIDTRYTPRLQFVLDQGVKKSIEIATILKRVLPEDSAGGAIDAGGEDDDIGRQATLDEASDGEGGDGEGGDVLAAGDESSQQAADDAHADRE